jgi:DeoR/GlpR family transcriptional regulator of sugar metabolism
MVQRSKRVVVVADSSKFTRTAFATICAADQINVIITDSGTDEKMLKELRQLGIEIIIA